MILESIVTTTNQDASVNVSPMGPRILDVQPDGRFSQFELRPFDTSTTLANLRRNRQGVMHVHDDVGLFARSAIQQLNTDQIPNIMPAKKVRGHLMLDACRAYEFRVGYIDELGPRKSLHCDVVAVHRWRDFFGFNRAKHAVLEAAILATRVDFLPAQEIVEQYRRLKTIVEKTAGPQEIDAFDLLERFVYSKPGIEHGG